MRLLLLIFQVLFTSISIISWYNLSMDSILYLIACTVYEFISPAFVCKPCYFLFFQENIYMCVCVCVCAVCVLCVCVCVVSCGSSIKLNLNMSYSMLTFFVGNYECNDAL